MPKGIRKNSDPARQKRRQALFKRAISEVKYATELRPYFPSDVETVRRVANGNTIEPHRTTDEAMARYLKVAIDSYDAYLAGTIDLNALWEKRGEDAPRYGREKLSIHAIEEMILALKSSARFDLLQWLIGIVRKDTMPPPSLPPVVELSPDASDRLRALFRLSIAADETEPGDVAIDPALLEWLTEGLIDVSFPDEAFVPLLPYLYRVTEWVTGRKGIRPRLDYSQTYEGDLDSLLGDLQSENNESLQESNK
jgi:hypothetical protein